MSDNRFKHSYPISIPSSGAGHRSRSVSFSTASSDDESNSPPLQTPSSSVPAPHIVTAHSPSTSPILSYFFQPQKNHSQVNSHSPTSMFGSMGRGFSARPHEQAILEEDEHEPSLVRHARRLSTSAGWTGGSRFNASTEQTERGAGLLRRLSLGNALVRPQVVSPPRQTSPLPPVPDEPRAHNGSTVKQKKRRATLGVPGDGSRPRRSPSPMGERILKGHFDGFN